MHVMKIVLAPMEGLADYRLRQLLTAVGEYDWCVTEFIRVSGALLPSRVFHRWCPELLHGARTLSGTPVHVQLLGSDPASMAANAQRAVELGAPAIDINFGCPAKTVNRHGGGAVLLDCPETVYQVVQAVRQALPATIPVSAKMRLGNLDGSRALDNAQAIAAAGASWLTVHGRTRAQGYRPPAYWDQIGHISAALSLPVIANGEIWSAADANDCLAQSGCQALMLGRGAVSDPFLPQRVRGQPVADGWPALQALLLHYLAQLHGSGSNRQLAGRIKQWLNYLRRDSEPAAALFAALRQLDCPQAMRDRILAMEVIPDAATRPEFIGSM